MTYKPLGLKPVPGMLSIFQNVQNQVMPFPEHKAFLAKSAASSIYDANLKIIDAGGRLYISEMWRSSDDQRKSYIDFVTGRKASFSLPPGLSMHESGRAIDIDTRPDKLRIPHEKIREILISCGWSPLVPLGSLGDYHYEYRSTMQQKKYAVEGYIAMVDDSFKDIRHLQMKYKDIDYEKVVLPENFIK